MLMVDLRSRLNMYPAPFGAILANRPRAAGATRPSVETGLGAPLPTAFPERIPG